MNVLSDFEIRVNAAIKSHVDDDLARLSKIIKEKDEQLQKLEKRLASEKESKVTKPVVKKPAVKKPTAKKDTAKKEVSKSKPVVRKTSPGKKKS